MSNSTAKNLFVSIVFLFYLSSCAEGGSGSGSKDSSGGNSGNNIIERTVIDIGDEWFYRKGTSSPPSDWNSAGFDDTTWLAGNTSIGYGDGDDSTILSDMSGNYVTVYARKSISYDSSINIQGLTLEVDYDDGFVAYINGNEVARANMPDGPPTFDTLASSSSESGTPIVFNLDNFISYIGNGDNVLAVEIHNSSLGSSDLTFKPRLLVNVEDPSPTVSLSANPSNVVMNGSTTLNWNSTSSTDCTASGDWSGSKGTSGSQIINALTTDSNFILSCNGAGGNANDSVNVTVTASSPPTVSLSASPTSVAMNGSTTLSWSSTDATDCTASGGWSGNKGTSGSQTTNTLTTDSNFILSCNGAGGNANDSVNVTVVAPSTPTVNLSASPSNVSFNGSTTLNWNSANVTDCTASGDWSGSKGTSGSQTINALTTDSNFILSCNGAGGNANDSVNVTVTASSPPTVSLSASPTSVAMNGSTTLSWSSTDATDCTASGGWSGNKGTSGSQTTNTLTTDSNFILSCNGAGGNANDSVNVTVTVPSPPTVSLSASPTSVAMNGSTTLSWSSTDATDCTASGGWSGNKGTSGSQTINALTTDSNFILSCNGVGGNANDSVNVTVTVPSPPTVSLSASPTSVAMNGSTTLSWSSTDTTDCTASGDWSGNKGASGSQVISSLDSNRIFALSCTGPNGTANTAVSVAISSSSGLSAFPGAEGYGAQSIGGRGGQVIKVTNLNDSGPGSLRAAVNASGSRIVVFEVSGIINLQSNLEIDNPYITIAGQTSPGGILVTGRTTKVNTNDVIIRYMRFRAGSHNVASADQHDTIQVLGRYWDSNEAYNIIFDHCSISWGIDENMGVSGGVTNMTIQWSIISEGLNNAGHSKPDHSKGLLISGKHQFANTNSVHHNYFAHNQDRNPRIATPTDVEMRVDVVNNVAYNWKGGIAPHADGNPEVNWVHNYAKQGLNSNDYTYEVAGNASVSPVEQIFYVVGNIGSTRLSQSDPDWNVGNYYQNEPLSTAWRKDQPWDVPPVTTTQMSHDYALQILQTVGASLPVRDSVDTRIVDDFANLTGTIIDDINYPGDYPTFANVPAPTDTDNDGMSDSWELANGLNTNADDSALDADGDGYTNIEEYLHSLAH